MQSIRETGSIELIKVIIHVIDHKNNDQAQISPVDINVSTLPPKIRNFIKEHIRTSIDNNESKLAKFTHRGTVVQDLINEMIVDPQQFFVAHSQQIANSLFESTPATASSGCLIVSIYSNTIETFAAIIKLDKHDSFTFTQKSKSAPIELLVDGNGVPNPDRNSKLHKIAIIRNTDVITDEELPSKPGLLILDKQVSDFSQYFYQDFLDAEFLMSNARKSEKLIVGISKYLKEVPELDTIQGFQIVQTYGRKIYAREEFTVDESARQIFSPFFEGKPERLNQVVQNLETALLVEGIGDNNLRGEMTSKIERLLGFKKIKTRENVYIRIPAEIFATKVEITDSINTDGQDILIKDVHLID